MGMRLANIKMSTTVNRVKLLDTVRENFEQHAKIVAEARNGYVAKAREALEKRLEDLRTGKVVSLSFSLTPPQDYSEVYKNSIAMLEWSIDENIVLEADEFRQLVRDEWDWTDSFYASNRLYSKMASDYEGSK